METTAALTAICSKGHTWTVDPWKTNTGGVCLPGISEEVWCLRCLVDLLKHSVGTVTTKED